MPALPRFLYSFCIRRWKAPHFCTHSSRFYRQDNGRYNRFLKMPPVANSMFLLHYAQIWLITQIGGTFCWNTHMRLTARYIVRKTWAHPLPLSAGFAAEIQNRYTQIPGAKQIFTHTKHRFLHGKRTAALTAVRFLLSYCKIVNFCSSIFGKKSRP